jgi:hypothetical protein
MKQVSRIIIIALILATWLIRAPMISAAPQILVPTAPSTIPKYEKFEITFTITNSMATKPQWPYDPSPPPGITPGLGISVIGHFLPPGSADWTQAYQVPGFYYQSFDEAVKGYNQEWYYPKNEYSWKVRFAPPTEGVWQYRLTVIDAGGNAETNPVTFTVSPSANRGFVRVAKNDPRYLEFDNGTYFPALGYNNNYNRIRWTNPVLDNEPNFQK